MMRGELARVIGEEIDKMLLRHRVVMVTHTAPSWLTPLDRLRWMWRRRAWRTVVRPHMLYEEEVDQLIERVREWARVHGETIEAEVMR